MFTVGQLQQIKAAALARCAAQQGLPSFASIEEFLHDRSREAQEHDRFFDATLGRIRIRTADAWVTIGGEPLP